MGMTIDEHIAQLIRVKHYAAPRHYETLDMAIDTMRKYQQLQADYENRIKADMAAMLEDLRLRADETQGQGIYEIWNCKTYRYNYTAYSRGQSLRRRLRGSMYEEWDFC